MTSKLLPLAVLCTVACGDTGGGARPPPTPVQNRPVEVWLNGERLGVLPDSAIRARQDYVALLPAEARDPASWHRLQVSSPQKAALSIPMPASRYRNHDFRLFVDAKSGVVAFGIFRPLPPGASARILEQAKAPSLLVTNADKIEIWSRDPTPAAGVELVVTVGSGAEQKKFSASDLSSLREKPLIDKEQGRKANPDLRNRDIKKAGGWLLEDVFQLAKVAPGERVLVTSADQQTTPVDPRHATLSTNRRGSFSVFYLDEMQRIQRVRNVVSVTPQPKRTL